MNVMSVIFNAKNNISDNAVDYASANPCSLYDLAYDLRRMFEDNARKHCSTIEVPKDKALRLAESIYNIACCMSLREPSNASGSDVPSVSR